MISIDRASATEVVESQHGYIRIGKTTGSGRRSRRPQRRNREQIQRVAGWLGPLLAPLLTTVAPDVKL